MSVLETPRIYFKGHVSWDPITTNNDAQHYDERAGNTLFANVATRVSEFRNDAIGSVVSGNWNPHGTNRAGFFDTSVCGFDLGAGTKKDDPFVSSSVRFEGMLVDLEPFGYYSSQLFFDHMFFGVDGGYRIFAPRTSRITSRYLNVSRYTGPSVKAGVGSVVWQTSFAKGNGLRIDAFDSAALKGFVRAMEDDDIEGLTVRFNTYRTIYYNQPGLTNGSPGLTAAEMALQTKLSSGGFQPNPARSCLVGVVGLWRRGELGHEPNERTLVPVKQPALATAYARVSRSSVTVDFGNSVSETDQTLKKDDIGPLSIVAIDPSTSCATDLAVIDSRQYDRAAYDSSAGIVTARLSSDVDYLDLRFKNLEIRNAAGIPLLTELPLRAIPATPNLYLDEGQNTIATFQVYDRGEPVNRSVAVIVFLLDSIADNLDVGSRMATDAKGVLSIPILSASPGIVAYVPCFSETEAPSGDINPLVNTYMYVRVLPADLAIAQASPTWDNVYVKVLANWNAMAPCMDNWLMLNDPDRVKASGLMLKRLTAPTAFESLRFMPVTRDMSIGKRALLYQFLNAGVNEVNTESVRPNANVRTQNETSPSARSVSLRKV